MHSRVMCSPLKNWVTLSFMQIRQCYVFILAWAFNNCKLRQTINFHIPLYIRIYHLKPMCSVASQTLTVVSQHWTVCLGEGDTTSLTMDKLAHC